MLAALAGLLGLLQRDPIEFLQKGPVNNLDAHLSAKLTLSGDLTTTVIHGAESIQRLIDERAAAKKAKNFAEADRIRDELKSQGIVLEDSAGVTTWRRA